MRYEVVSQDDVFAALNSELMSAYVEAVIVPSKPERKTLAKMAVVVNFLYEWVICGLRRTNFDPEESFRWLPGVWICIWNWRWREQWLLLVGDMGRILRVAGIGIRSYSAVCHRAASPSTTSYSVVEGGKDNLKCRGRRGQIFKTFVVGLQMGKCIVGLIALSPENNFPSGWCHLIVLDSIGQLRCISPPH
jgi:hypothetical protein